MPNPNPTSGTTAAGTADDASPPVKEGGVNHTTQPTYTDGQTVTQEFDTRGNAKVTVVGLNGTLGAAVVVPSLALATPAGAQAVASFPETFNGATWDPQFGNWTTSTGDSGAKTTGTFNGLQQTNYNSRGAVITCLLGTVTGAVTTWQTGLQWSPDGGATWIGLTALGANDTAATSGRTYTWMVYPTNISQAAGATPANLAPNGGPTQLNAINMALPRSWRFTAVVSVATSIVITAVYVNYIV